MNKRNQGMQSHIIKRPIASRILDRNVVPRDWTAITKNPLITCMDKQGSLINEIQPVATANQKVMIMNPKKPHITYLNLMDNDDNSDEISPQYYSV